MDRKKYQKLNEQQETEEHDQQDMVQSSENGNMNHKDTKNTKDEKMNLLPTLQSETVFSDHEDNDLHEEHSTVEETLPEPASLPEQTATTTNNNDEVNDKLKKSVKFANQDGVFSNLSAKPELTSPPEPESTATSTEQPPAYESVAEDSVPPYQVSVLLNNIIHGSDNGMQAGSPAVFFISLVVTFLFQAIGFLVCYVFSGSHAGKLGARTGFGLLLIQFGVMMRNKTTGDYDESLGQQTEGDDDARWFLSYFLMIFGWLVSIHASTEYLRMRKLSQQAHHSSGQTEATIVVEERV